jgi:hypothetical protein
MLRKQVLESMAGVEREYRVAARGVDRLLQQSQSDPTVLGDAAVMPADVRRCLDNLENTYLVRLFAVFEESLREVWAAAFAKTTYPKTKQLLDGCAARQHVRHDDLINAHQVRDYRNAIVHGGQALQITLPQSRAFLCAFFGWMPKHW